MTEQPKSYYINGKTVQVSEPVMSGEQQVINITLANPSKNAGKNFKVTRSILSALDEQGLTTEASADGSISVKVNDTLGAHAHRGRPMSLETIKERVHETLEGLSLKVAGKPLSVSEPYDADGAKMMDVQITEPGGANDNRQAIVRITNALGQANFNTEIITNGNQQVGVRINLTGSLPHIQRTDSTATIESLRERVDAALQKVKETGRRVLTVVGTGLPDY